jgi:serine/threonine protein kinase
MLLLLLLVRMLSCGVEHRDIRPPNVLWNPETSNVVLVDFERSEILKQVSVLQETSPNRKRKRKRKHPQLDPSLSKSSDRPFINSTKCFD